MPVLCINELFYLGNVVVLCSETSVLFVPRIQERNSEQDSTLPSIVIVVLYSILLLFCLQNCATTK